MAHPIYTVFAGDVLPIFFNTFAGATGAPITITGLAVADIKIYKDGSTTERSSTSGFTLLDTDGIDFDGITGIHGFSIDTADNTDASFYTTGAWFTVVVSTITVDSQTVSFIAAQFRIVPAESVAGVPKVDVSTIAGSAVSTSTAQIGVNVVNNAGTAITSASGVQEVKVASIANNAITAASAATDFGTEIATAVFSTAVDGSYTAYEMCRIIMATLGGQASGLGTTTALYKNRDGSKTRITATVDADGNRSSITFTDVT